MSYDSEYYQQNKEKKKKQVLEYRRNNPEKVKKTRRKYQQSEGYKKCQKKFYNTWKMCVDNVSMYYGCQNPECASRSNGYVSIELQFHHIRDKAGPVSSICNKSYKKTAEEINKCVVLCANCHARYHVGLVSLSEAKVCKVNNRLIPLN